MTPVPTIPKDTLSELFEQAPPELFALACGLSIALILLLMWLTFFKPLRDKSKSPKQKLAPAAQPSHFDSPVATPEPKSTQRTVMDSGAQEMPGLEVLLDTSILAQEVSPADRRTPQPAARPTPPALSPRREERNNRIKLHTGAMVDAERVLVVLRDSRDGKFIVQIDDVGYRTLVDAPEAKKKFIRVMKDLSEVVTKPDDNPPAIEEAKSELPRQPDATAKPARSIPPTPEPKKGAPSYRLEDNLVHPVGDAGFIPHIDLASAIEAYLQHKIEHFPEYAGREIHVRPAPGGGVLIQVDTKFYQAVGDVEDREVRDFLMAMIQEWQDQQRR